MDFGCLRGGGLGVSAKKGKFVTKIFFSGNVEWGSLKIVRNDIYNVKADVKQQGIKEVVAVSCYFS